MKKKKNYEVTHFAFCTLKMSKNACWCAENTWFNNTSACFNISLRFPHIIFQQGASGPKTPPMLHLAISRSIKLNMPHSLSATGDPAHEVTKIINKM